MQAANGATYGERFKMTSKITIKPSDHSYACEDDETVLAAAMRNDLMLPYGCRNGACGTCKGRILSGDVDYGPHQASTLTDDEKRIGLALFCCARPLTDLVIEVREVRRAGDIQIKRLPCRIESIDKAAPDVAIVRFKLPANERLQFLAGQYIDFLLKDGKRRSFSLATAPHDDQLLELHIRHVPNGFFTDLLFAQYKGREILRFEGPLGAFYLREDSDKPVDLRRRRDRLRTDQGHHRARAASQARSRDGAVLGRALAARSLPAGPAGPNGSRSTATSRSSPCCRIRSPRTRGRAAPVLSTRPWRRTFRTCRATRSTRAAAR